MSNENDMKTAKCLCGAVSFRAHVPSGDIQCCHCKQCQQWTGGGPLWTVRVKDVVVTGADHIKTYRASEHGERAFCKTCGATLYWKMQGRNIAFLPVGLFEDQSGFNVTEEIFVDHRPCWLPAFEGAEQQDEATMQAQLHAYLAKEAK